MRGPITAITVNSTTGAITGKDGFGNTGTVRVAAGIYNNEEEVRDHNILNEESGVIQANGQFAAAIYTRSNSFELINEGKIIAYETQPGSLTPTIGDTSAAIVTWDGRLLKSMPDADASSCATQPDGVCTGREAGYGKSYIDNQGTIIGNVVITGSNGLLVLGLLGTNGDPVTLNGTNADGSVTTLSGGLAERRDSYFTNEGDVTGKFYYGQGSHTLINSGTITGNIVVDQRRGTNYLDRNNYADTLARQINPAPYNVYIAGQTGFGADDDDDKGGDNKFGSTPPTVYTSDPGLTYNAALQNAIGKLLADNPDHHFTFENSGTMLGDIKVLTNDIIVPGYTPTPHTVDLLPHITGSGAGSSFAAPSLESGFIGGHLFIGSGTMTGWTVTEGASSISPDGAGGTTKTTIAPVIDHVVHTGEWFMVATFLDQITGGPQVDTVKLPGVEDTALVDWAVG